MDDLSTRIAAIHGKHLLVRYDRRAWWCQCGDDCLSVEGSHSQHVADAVIRELRQEYRIDIGYGGYEFEQDRAAAVERLQEIHEDWGDDPPETGTVLQRRYVTEWENDDE